MNLLGEIEDGPAKGAKPSQIKSAKVNIHAAEDMAAAAAGQPKKEKIKGKTGEINPESFKIFQTEMGPEVTDVDMDELIKRFMAWQLFTQVFESPAEVKAEIIKKFHVKTV